MMVTCVEIETSTVCSVLFSTGNFFNERNLMLSAATRRMQKRSFSFVVAHWRGMNFLCVVEYLLFSSIVGVLENKLLR
jgi:hypothetical protein